MGQSILIVDDEEEVRNLFATFLKRKGFECLQAADALAAMRTVRKSAPDVVVTDYAMPEINGIELLKELRAFKADLPVVMISGTADMHTALIALKEHAFDFLAKPVDSKELLSVITQALQRPEPDPAEVRGKVREFGPVLLEEDLAPGVQVVHFNRPLDEFSIKAFSQSLGQLQATLGERVVLVLRNVSYINSVGLNFLLEYLQRFKSGGRRIVLANISDPVHRYLKLLGYLDYLPVVPTIAAALELLRKP